LLFEKYGRATLRANIVTRCHKEIRRVFSRRAGNNTGEHKNFCRRQVGEAASAEKTKSPARPGF
jgi:hypothetical protein